MLKELEALGNGDPMPIVSTLSSTASAIAQLMPKGDEAQHLGDVLNPPDALKKPEPEQGEDNYNNVDLSPRPGR